MSKNELMSRRERLEAVFAGEQPDRTPILGGCSPDAPEQKNEAQATEPTEAAVVPLVEPEPEPQPKPAKKLPEVVVIYGREEFIPFLELILHFFSSPGRL